jgi:MFS family permease
MQRDSLMTETLIDPPPPRVLFLPFLALCFANAAEAVEVLGSGYVLARVTTNKTERSLIAGGVYLGMLIGGLISGLVADRRGRSIVLKFALTLATVASVAAAATPNIVLLVICRVAAGIGVGSATPALFALASELAPPGRSAMAVCAVASFWMVGSLFTAGTAYAFFGHASQQQLEPSWAWDARWRGFALAASSLPVLSVLLCCAVVRDPKQRRTNTSSSTAEASGQERVSRTTMEIAEIRMAGVAQDGGNFSDDEPPRPADTRLLQGETLRMRVLPLMLSWAGLNFGYCAARPDRDRILPECPSRPCFCHEGWPLTLRSRLLMWTLATVRRRTSHLGDCAAQTIGHPKRVRGGRPVCERQPTWQSRVHVAGRESGRQALAGFLNVFGLCVHPCPRPCRDFAPRA